MLPVGILSIKTDPWNLEDNFRRIEHYARAAAERRARVIVTPESALDGYVFNADPTSSIETMLTIAQEVPNGSFLRRAGSLCRELNVFLFLGFLERAGGDLFSSCALITPDGRIAGVHRKVHVAGEFGLSPGGAITPFETEFGNVGILLCSDRTPENFAVLGVLGADVIVVPMDGPGSGSELEKLRVRAEDNGCWVIVANTWSSAMINPRGEFHLLRYETECVTVQLLDLERWPPCRRRFASRRPDLYAPLTTTNESRALYTKTGELTEAGFEQSTRYRAAILQRQNERPPIRKE
jgi:predicted amidohydrolase